MLPWSTVRWKGSCREQKKDDERAKARRVFTFWPQAQPSLVAKDRERERERVNDGMLGRVGRIYPRASPSRWIPRGEKRVANGDWPSQTSAWVMHQMRLVAVVDDEGEQADSIGITMRQERKEK